MCVKTDQGWAVAQPGDDSVHRIGLVTSKTGPGAVFSIASEYMAELAVEEINADGGLAGHPVELVVGDDATDAEQASLEARRLAAAGCRTVIAGVTSASFAGVASVLANTGCPVIHCLLNEGGGGSELMLRWGERPLDQVRAASRSVMTSCGGRRWYLIGNNYRWGHGAHAAGHRALEEVGGQVVGNEFVELGHLDFGRVIEEIERSGADCVLSTLVGADEVAFERQVWEAGLRTKWATLSLAMEESARERIVTAFRSHREAIDEHRRAARQLRMACGERVQHLGGLARHELRALRSRLQLICRCRARQ